MSHRQATDLRRGLVLRDWVDVVVTISGLILFAGLGVYTLYGWFIGG